jgi:alpha-D-xyloside xylohydrolase
MKRINRRRFGQILAGGAALLSSAGSTPLTAAENESPQTLEFSQLLPGVWRATIGAPEEHTPVRARLTSPHADGLRALPPASQPPLEGVEGAVTARGTRITLPLAAGEQMYGFGLQLLSFQQRGKKRTIRVNADPRVDSGDSHAPVPFYVTTRGYGVLIDTFRHAQFYCGDAHRVDRNVESGAGHGVNTPAQMRASDRDRSGEVRVEVPRSAGLDVYLFSGPAMVEAVQRYNLFSGGGVNPPEWGLGFWYRAEMHLDAEGVLALARELRASKIPCDVLGLEPGWQTHAYSCSFAWDRTRFADPARFLTDAQNLGLHVNLWEHAFTHPSSPIYQQLLPHSGDYLVWQGLVPDFAGDPARRVFADYHGRALIDAGVSGFKLDECDNSDFTEGWSWPDFAQFPSGLDGETMHAAFGLLYQETILSAFRARHRDTFGLVRSSGALASSYPFVLYSDLYDHRQFVRALVNAGFCGLLWCPEVRDAVSEEDLIRRLQTVVCSPLAMVNAWYIRNPPWKQIDRQLNNADRFAPEWEKLQARCRQILDWRMALVPYLRSAFAAYAETGIPPFRALILDFPEDSSLLNVDDQYMIGDRLMAAPLFAGEKQRNVVLPAGTWHEFWSGRSLEGGRVVEVGGTFAEIPLYVRGDAVMPWASPAASTSDSAARELRVRVYGSGAKAWKGQGPDLDGFSLSWDHDTKHGTVSPARSAVRPYRVVGWERIGDTGTASHER